jgi:hypothetical protein
MSTSIFLELAGAPALDAGGTVRVFPRRAARPAAAAEMARNSLHILHLYIGLRGTNADIDARVRQASANGHAIEPGNSAGFGAPTGGERNVDRRSAHEGHGVC